jgi:hypothetical protein
VASSRCLPQNTTGTCPSRNWAPSADPWQGNLEVLGLLKAFGAEPHANVLPSVLRAAVPRGNATLKHFFEWLDFSVAGFSPHGTRGTAATLLREH